MVTGSCLCGLIRYEIDEPGIVINLCHCSKCRKSSGAAFNSVLHIGLDRFRWIEGAAWVRAYVMDSGYGRSFCNRCGAPVPAVSEQTGNVAVPAGSLDDDPDCVPVGHLYVGSRARFYDLDAAYARFDTTPADDDYQPHIDRYLRLTGLEPIDFRPPNANDWAVIGTLASADGIDAVHPDWLAARTAFAGRRVHFLAERAGQVVGYGGAEQGEPGRYEWFLIVSDTVDFAVVANQLYNRLIGDAIETGATLLTHRTRMRAESVEFLKSLRFYESERFTLGDGEAGVTLIRDNIRN